ncbi:PhnD/SsuA/transferrin family substrate-binding protein [Rubrivivax rivuli]|uniref:ABC transporter substrate-binding protein n=1 Tax=Rubrivivax rivuli TaxID=1862385 RepID=A0A437RET9_9BURK|nr:PhnD/SsuA/transferrin family substrate-binding protein [Rubrivivax rivuli]RVU45261.1 hypothetical protein EOE66_14055 [Rubrivivax rivuli]
MNPTRHPGLCTRRLCLQRWSLASAAAGLALSTPWAVAQGAKRLKVGLTPFLSPRQLMGTFEPLRLHLAARLQREVEFYTAPSFERMLDNARAPDQPFTLMPVHLALMAIEDWGFTLVARSTAESTLALWQPPEMAAPWPADAAPAAVLQALRGRRIGLSGALTLAALAVERWREERGLVSAVELRPHANLSGAVLAVRRGDVDFVGAPDTALRDSLPPGSPDFRRFLTLGRLEAPAFVASPAAAPADVAALRAALLAFGGAGTSFASAQYAAGTAADLSPWRSYATRARQLLATAAETRPR